MTRGLDDDGRFDEAMAAIGTPMAMARPFKLIPFGDIEFSSGPKWLIRGLLAATGLATIYGPPKSYKSFVAADVALAIAGGTPWAGRHVEQGAVVYIVGEGASGFSDRIAGNRAARGLAADLPFYLVKSRPNLGCAGGDVAALIAAIEPVMLAAGQRLAAIFIDTLVRTLAGAAENDEGMRNFTDNAEALADHFGCLAVAVHHTGKDQTRGMRGSSALHGAVVTSWRVEKSAPLVATISLEDAKDGESGLTWSAHLERFVYGIDPHDRSDEAVLIVAEITEPSSDGVDAQLENKTKPTRAIPAQLRNFMACLDIAIGHHGFQARPFADGPEIRVVSEQAVRTAYFARRGDEANDEAKRKSFKNALKAGVERRLVLVEEVKGEAVLWRKEAA